MLVHYETNKESHPHGKTIKPGIVKEKGSVQDLIKGLRSDFATLKQECDEARVALASVTNERFGQRFSIHKGI